MNQINDYSCAEPQVKQADVFKQEEMMEKSISMLEEYVVILSKKLEPVLYNDPALCLAKKDTSQDSGHCQIAEYFKSNSERIRDIHARISDLIGRLQI